MKISAVSTNNNLKNNNNSLKNTSAKITSFSIINGFNKNKSKTNISFGHSMVSTLLDAANKKGFYNNFPAAQKLITDSPDSFNKLLTGTDIWIADTALFSTVSDISKAVVDSKLFKETAKLLEAPELEFNKMGVLSLIGIEQKPSYSSYLKLFDNSERLRGNILNIISKKFSYYTDDEMKLLQSLIGNSAFNLKFADLVPDICSKLHDNSRLSPMGDWNYNFAKNIHEKGLVDTTYNLNPKFLGLKGTVGQVLNTIFSTYATGEIAIGRKSKISFYNLTAVLGHIIDDPGSTIVRDLKFKIVNNIIQNKTVSNENMEYFHFSPALISSLVDHDGSKPHIFESLISPNLEKLIYKVKNNQGTVPSDQIQTFKEGMYITLEQIEKRIDSSDMKLVKPQIDKLRKLTN